MSVDALTFPRPAAAAASAVVHVDFRAAGRARADEAAEAPRGGFPLALIFTAMVGGAAIAVGAWLLGLEGWASMLCGWISASALVPTLPFMPVVGAVFWQPEPPSAEVCPLPLARDLAAWRDDLAAEAGPQSAA